MMPGDEGRGGVFETRVLLVVIRFDHTLFLIDQFLIASVSCLVNRS